MHTIKKLLTAKTLLATVLCFFVFTSVAFAQAPTPNPDDPTDCPAGTIYIGTILKGCYSFNQYIEAILNWAIVFAALLAMVRLTIGGIGYIFSQGDTSKMNDARDTITSAIFGLVLVAIAFIVIKFVGDNIPSFWGVNLFTLP